MMPSNSGTSYNESNKRSNKVINNTLKHPDMRSEFEERMKQSLAISEVIPVDFGPNPLNLTDFLRKQRFRGG